ncbi:hypothetical protein [Shimia marina]|uniref:hypothetical protein n=1 Tax=Shimia marina TaxID=321267 RepID=UPI00118756F0|nr:hypothetical protein [Shimia marina]
MKKRLENPSLITPSYEDKGLFKKPPTELVVQLIPKFGKNTRRDVIIKGLVQGDVEVEVVFAGRRKKQAAELVALLRRKWEVATYRLPKDVPPPDRKEIQLPTRVQGSWRTRMTEMGDGTQDLYLREYQLLVARWAYHSEGGAFRSFGEPPFVEQLMDEANADV